jgi:hypothetical protein
MAEIERNFKRQNRWYLRLWRWVLGKKPVIDVTQYSTYSNERVVIPTLDDLLALAETLPPPPPKMLCVRHGHVTGTYPDRKHKVYCSECVEEWKHEFEIQFSTAETVDDLRSKYKLYTSMGVSCDGIIPSLKKPVELKEK